FFQAEDGIRAPLVTGVQTCALPISFRQAPNWKIDTHTFVSPGTRLVAEVAKATKRPSAEMDGAPKNKFPGETEESLPCVPPDARSEERRVGRECRGRVRGERERSTE